MSKRIETRIELYRDILKILSVFAFGIGGGTIGLLFKLDKAVSLPLLFLGASAEVALLFGMARVILKIESLIEEIKDE